MFGRQFAAASAFAFSAMLFAADAIRDFKADPASTFSEKDGIYTVTGNAIISAAPGALVPVDPAKKYRISGEFRIVPGSAQKTGYVYFAWSPKTDKGQVISPHACNTYKELTTELLKDVKPSDKVIYVKDASRWGDAKGIRLGFIVFRAKEDMSDIPNYNYNFNGSRPAKVEKTDDGWKVTLKGVIGMTGKKGEKVRLHYDGSSYPYLNGNSLTQEWKTLSVVVNGMGNDALSNVKFWPGTKKIGAVIFKNGKTDFQFRNIRIEEVK